MKSISIKLSKMRILFIILTIVCMILIFLFSMENSSQSSRTSGNIIKLILRIIHPGFSELSKSAQARLVYNAQFLVRKLAHFTIYNILGFFMSFSFGRHRLLSKRTLCTLIIGFLYAVSDELHQSLVPGRSCEFRDIMIDTAGVLTGIIISLLLLTAADAVRKCRKKREANSNQKK